jgi:hypothetical protein
MMEASAVPIGHNGGREWIAAGDRMRPILFRLLMVHVGIIAACFGAAFAFAIIESWNLTIPEGMTRTEAHNALLINSALISVVGLFFAYLPSLVLGVVGEVFRLRTVLFYAVAGGLIGLRPALESLPSFVAVAPGSEALTATPLTAFPAVGILGGCLYWLVAGCKAGFPARQKAPS